MKHKRCLLCILSISFLSICTFSYSEENDVLIPNESINQSNPYDENPKESKTLLIVPKSGSTPSKFPEITINFISILLTVITLAITVFTGIGISLIMNTRNERDKLLKTREALDKEKAKLEETFVEQRNFLEEWKYKLLNSVKEEFIQFTQINRAKTEIQLLLDDKELLNDPEKINLLYRNICNTTAQPDNMCIGLYYKILEKFDANNIDMIRAVRNGLQKFSESSRT